MTESGMPFKRILSFMVPVKTISEANTSDHWTKRARRRRTQSLIVWHSFRKATKDVEVTLPCHITVIRLSSRSLDTMENLPMALKAITDELADILVPEKGGWYVTKAGTKKRIRGHSDSDPRLSWSYAQEKAKTQAVRVEIRY